MDQNQNESPPEFVECDECAAKPGSPELCDDCLKRRAEFEATRKVNPGPVDGPEFCGAQKIAPAGVHVFCRRLPNHEEDHFDDVVGLGWSNENSLAAGLTQDERVHAILDRLGVPRARDEGPFSLVQRMNLFVDRISRRLHTQVENNMIYHETVKDALALLVGAPNSGQFRIKSAIDKLRALVPARQTPAGIHLQ